MGRSQGGPRLDAQGTVQGFLGVTYLGAARTFFTRWFWRASHSRLKSVVGAAKLIQQHLPNLLTYLQHGITNAGSRRSTP